LILLFAPLVIVAALRDIVSYTIPNWISAVLAIAFLPAAYLAGVNLPALGVTLIVGLVVLGAGIGMFAMKWVGGGDAKLMAAASLWLGIQGIGPFFLYTGLAGGLLAAMLLAMRSAWVRPFAAGGAPWLQRLATPGAATPYGAAIAVGALAAFPEGLLMRVAHGGF
jgi:prepilin peptidase CpaA